MEAHRGMFPASPDAVTHQLPFHAWRMTMDNISSEKIKVPVIVTAQEIRQFEEKYGLYGVGKIALSLNIWKIDPQMDA